MTGTRPAPRRRYLAPVVVIVLLLGQAAFLYLTRPAPPAPVRAAAGDDDSARVGSIAGRVVIRSALGTREAQLEDRLLPGDRIQTGEHGGATIELEHVGAIRLDAGSLLERTSATGARAEFYLHAGRMLVQTTSAGETELPVCHTPHATFHAEPGQENEYLVLAEP